MYSETKRIDYLDSIRGLAALTVLWSHSLGAFDWPAPVFNFINLPFINIVFDGHSAVTMFFALSGFVLSRPYLAATGPGQPPRNITLPTFYLRRFTRIWLPWLAAYILSVVAQRWLFHMPTTTPPVSQWLGSFWHILPTWGNFLKQCVFLEHNSYVQLLNQDWSLGVELKGSLLIPLLVFLLVGRRWLFLGLLTLAVFWGPNTGSAYVTFVLGALLAKYGDGLTQWLKACSLAVRLGCLVTGLAFYETHHIARDLYGVTEHGQLFMTGTALGCGLILLACLSSKRLQATLNWQVLVLFGKISFSIYLLQFIPILCGLPPLVRYLNDSGIQQTWILLPLTLLASTAMTVGLSLVNFRLVEMPSIKFGHRLTTLLQERFLKK